MFFANNTNKPVINGDIQTIVYFMLSVIVVLFFALSNLGQEVEFRSTIIFTTVFMASYLLLLGLSFTRRGKSLRTGNASLFFQHDVTVGSLLWIPIGIAGAFGFSVLANNIGLDSTGSALVAIAGSGIIMMFIFFRTGSILIPIIIHGAFNALVIVLASPAVNFEFLSNTPIPIPEIGISFGTLNALASESIFQFMLVAPSEEMFKILVLSFVLLAVKGRFDTRSVWVYVGAGFAIGLWTVYHMIQAI